MPIQFYDLHTFIVGLTTWKDTLLPALALNVGTGRTSCTAESFNMIVTHNSAGVLMNKNNCSQRIDPLVSSVPREAPAEACLRLGNRLKLIKTLISNSVQHSQKKGERLGSKQVGGHVFSACGYVYTSKFYPGTSLFPHHGRVQLLSNSQFCCINQWNHLIFHLLLLAKGLGIGSHEFPAFQLYEHA